MKKIFILTLALMMFATPANLATSAAKENNTISCSDNTYIEYLEDGSYLVTTLDPIDEGISAFATTVTRSKTFTHYSSSNEALCALRVTGTFSYNGSTATCTNVTYAKIVSDDAWSVENVTTSHSTTSATKVSATAKGDFIYRVLGIKIKTVPASVTIDCDKNGNIS